MFLRHVDREGGRAAWMLGRELTAMHRLADAACVFELALFSFNPDLAELLYPGATDGGLLGVAVVAAQDGRVGGVFVRYYLSQQMSPDETTSALQLGGEWFSFPFEAQMRAQPAAYRALLAVTLLGLVDCHAPHPSFGGESFMLDIEAAHSRQHLRGGASAPWTELQRLVGQGRLLEAAHLARFVTKSVPPGHAQCNEPGYTHAASVVARTNACIERERQTGVPYGGES
eukprot:gene48107-30828_t